MKKILLTLCTALPTLFLLGQSPGGVTPAVWYKADAGVYSNAGTTAAADNATVQQWNDQMGTGYNLAQATAGQRPTFSNQSTLANFNPTVSFNADFMAADPGNGNAIINRAQGSIYVSGKMNTVGAAKTSFAGFDQTMNFPGLSTSNTNPSDKLMFYSGGTYNSISSNLFVASKGFVAGSSWLNGGGTPGSNVLAKVWLDGNENTYNNTSSNVTVSNATRIFRIGGDTDWGSLDGQLNETIVFANPLSASEKARVDSYLSVKWGSTLLGNYVSSGNTVVWNTSATYQNNILGIARDNNGALYQKQSRSENPNQKLIIGAGNSLANTNAANTNTLTDGQFLIVGDNGLKQSLTTPLVYTGGSNGAVNYRFEAIWKVENTGNVGTVTIAWPKGIKNLYLVQSGDAVFDGTDTFAPMATEVIVNGVVYNTVNVTLANGEYFTFAGLATNPGGIAIFPGVWYKSENVSSTQWIDASINKLDLTSTAGVTTNPGDQQHNFNTWTTGYSATKYYNFLDPNYSANYNAQINPVFGNYNNDGVSYMPLSIYGVARATGATNGQITGLDNEINTGHEPGLNANVNGTGLSPNFYRFSNGINQTATSLLAKLNETSVYFAHPYPGDGTATGTDNLILGLNGSEATITGQNKRSSVAGPYLKIGFANGLGFFNGDIQEVIWYKNILNTLEKQKVDTYLALKYGTTLSHDYINPDNVSVYNLTTNAGYVSNIAGIVHDDINGAINQKQSNSVNVGNQVLISTTGLANTNDANTSSLNNKQYLVWGDNGLEKKLVIPLSYTAGSNGETNYRFESIWKVQNTGTVGNVTIAWPKGIKNLYLVQSANATFANGNTFTPMTTEVTVNGVVYNTANVTLADGQFFTFAGYAHAPGGVVNSLSYWYRADKDAANTGAGTDVTSWTDFFSGAVSSQMGTNAFPKYVEGDTNYFNFNPGINFTAGTQTLGNTTVRTFSADSYDVFTFTKEGMAPGGNYPSIFRSLVDNAFLTGGLRRWDGLGIQMNNIVERLSNTGGNTDTGLASLNGTFAATIPSIMYYTFTANTTTRGLNGAVNFTTTNHSGTGVRNLNGGHLFGDSQFGGNGSDNRGFIGHLGETIIYGAGNLSVTERRRVDSYMAIKYGITLERVATDHYLGSDAGIVWNGSDNSGYNNNVFGITHDEISALHQKQSKSVNANQKLIIGAGSSLANTNAANTNSLTDGQYLIVGDNGLMQGLSIPLVHVTPSGGTNLRFASIWKVQNTNSTGQVIVAWPKGVPNLHLVHSVANDTFDNSDTFIPMTNEVTINNIVYNTATVTFNNGDYFTFAGYVYAPAGVASGIARWYRSDRGVTVDTDRVSVLVDQVSNSETITQATATRRPAYNSASNFINFNPNMVFTPNPHTALNSMTGGFAPGTTGLTSFSVAIPNASPLAQRKYIFGMSNLSASGDGAADNATRIAVGNVLCGNSTTPNIGKWRNCDQYASTGSWIIGVPSIIKAGSRPAPNNISFFAAQNGNVAATGNGAVAMNYTETGFGLGSAGDNGNDTSVYGWNGQISEVILYGGELSETDQRRVDSYLAIKHGITLGRVATDHYLGSTASASSVIWNGALNNTYNNNVFGIARADVGDFHQKVSKSINSGTILTIAKNNDFVSGNLASSRTGLPVNESYLLLGDNNNTSTVAYTPTEIGNCGEIIGATEQIKLIPRKWLVQRTSSVGATYLQANLAAYTADLNTDIKMYVADDENFTQNVVAIAGTQSGNNWVFPYNFDGDNTARYITFGGKFVAAPCEQCKGGTYTLRTGYQWNLGAWTNQTVNNKQNILLGNDADGNPLYASMYADYSANPSVEYVPTRYPRRYAGRWTIGRRYDNTNAQVQHRIELTKAMKASFQISNINTYRNNKNNFQVIGYCNGVAVMPKITYAYNTSYHTFNISGNQTIGTMSWRGFVPNVSTANVRFDRPVEQIVIICSVDRVNTDKTLRSILYSDITLECAEVVPPNPDNVYVSHSYTQDNLATCGGNTTMRIKVTSNNICDNKTINLHQALPSGLVYVPGSFNGNDLPAGAMTGATLTYAGGNLELSGLSLPSGEHWMYVDVANPGVVGTYPTQFTYEVTNGVNPTNTSSSSTVNLTYYQSADPVLSNPALTLSIKNNVVCGTNNMGITYRMKIDNPNASSITGAEILHMFDHDQIIQNVTYVTGEDEDGVITGTYPVDGAGATIDPINNNLFNLIDANLPVGVSYIDITVNTRNSYDIPDVQTQGMSSTFLVGFGSGECAESGEFASNQVVLPMCTTTPVCYKPAAVAGTTLETKHGITALNRAGVDNGNWPMVRNGAWTALESKEKGFVINRVATTAGLSSITNPIEGMMVYDEQADCLKIYAIKEGELVANWHCFNTQACPD